ncbi:cell division protein FtsK [Mycobacterium sp. SP-6446]|uniref:cell division protein FtsK n=1 Tax=Mycobacterium sp. SP-6446 TaxID=1834162 RepID=UPI0011156285|nr:cell division protein FtsK [Mycobacterium sp. SP-6446]
MTREGFIRSAVPAPPQAEGEIQLPDPGELQRPIQSKPPTWVWMAIFVVAVVILMVMLYRSGARQLSTGSFFIFPVMLMSMLMMMRGRGGADKDSRPAAINHRRGQYLRKLDEIRADVHKKARAQAVEIAWHHPDPANGALVRLVGTPRMWERDPKARNFGHVRLGVGVTQLKARLIPPVKVPPPEHAETVSAIAARDFLLTQNVVHDVSRPLHLFDQPGWCFFADEAERPRLQGVLRALVCQLCVFHGPDHVLVPIVTDDPVAWEWAKWLPHTADDEFIDASGPARLIFADVGSFMTRFETDLRGRPRFSPGMQGAGDPIGESRRLVIVVDCPGANCAPILGPGGGRWGTSVLEATGDRDSALATEDTAFLVDELGNLLKARKSVRKW